MWEVVSPRRYMFGKYFTYAIFNECLLCFFDKKVKKVVVTTTDNKLQQQKQRQVLLETSKTAPPNENSQPDVHRRFTPLIFPLWEKEHMEQVIFVSWSAKLSLLKGGHYSGAS